MTTPLVIVIPFYKNEYLVPRIVAALIKQGDELRSLNTLLILVNDSPEYAQLQPALDQAAKDLQGAALAHEVIVNPKNLGFVGATNAGLERARALSADAILLNSDAIPTPGCFTELRRVAELDPMIGFVSPRSNNASICSLPFENRTLKKSFEEAKIQYEMLAPYLPEMQFVPTGVGFCLYAKAVILKDFGLLDTIYAPGYNEENDFVFRANRCGFTAVLANRAFVFHDSGASFGDEFSLYDTRNREVLLARFPEYDRTVGEYLEGPVFAYEQLIASTLQRYDGVKSVAIDLSHFCHAHNGTYELGLNFVQALYDAADRNFRIVLLISQDLDIFHGVGVRFPDLARLAPDGPERFDVIIKPAQLFSLADFDRLSKKALYNITCMLDTIAWDCASIRTTELSMLWNLIEDTQDGVLFISTFSKERFEQRFVGTTHDKPLHHALQLSVDVHDYKGASEIDGEIDSEVSSVINGDPFILIIGNHYAHKFARPTAEYLEKEFPDRRFVALGGDNNPIGRVTTIKSGGLSNASVAALFRAAHAVVFPSHYEGFGFPIPHNLAATKHVLARRSSLNKEIGSRWVGPGKLTLWDDLSELKAALTAHLADNVSCFPVLQGDTNNRYNWKRMGEEVCNFIRQIETKDPLATRAYRRLKVLSYFNSQKTLEKKFQDTERARLEVCTLLHQRNLEYLALKEQVEHSK